jgi:nicotinamide phosphoribosyltransferase
MTTIDVALESPVLDPVALIDGYKYGHAKQYPEGTTRVYSNFTPRASRIPGTYEAVFFGLQYFLQRYLTDELQPFFDAPVDVACDRYARRLASYLGPANNVGTDHIRALHALGYIPLEFRALPEGSRVPLRVPFFTVENTHDDFAWLVNYYETLLSASVWLPSTSATQAVRFRRLLDGWAAKSGAPLDFVPWQGHDFSFRGMGGLESAAMSGAGHLVAFTGTDTVPSLDFVEHYYDAEGLIGGSVPATEHSVMCAGGRATEQQTFARLLDLYPSGVVSVVSDTWDLWKVLTDTLPSIKDKIMGRDGKLVIRPDSGDPVQIICGNPDAPVGSPAYKGVIELLWDTFGGTATKTRHCVLDPHIGCIYGDAITYDRADAILAGLAAKGFASSNMVFGVGSFTYQYVTRDSLGFAMKATWAKVNGEGRALYKQPVTDGGEKFSAKGRLAVLPHPTTGAPMLVNDATPDQEAASLLQPVWRDGHFITRNRFCDIRTRALSL